MEEPLGPHNGNLCLPMAIANGRVPPARDRDEQSILQHLDNHTDLLLETQGSNNALHSVQKESQSAFVA